MPSDIGKGALLGAAGAGGGSVTPGVVEATTVYRRVFDYNSTDEVDVSSLGIQAGDLVVACTNGVRFDFFSLDGFTERTRVNDATFGEDWVMSTLTRVATGAETSYTATIGSGQDDFREWVVFRLSGVDFAEASSNATDTTPSVTFTEGDIAIAYFCNGPDPMDEPAGLTIAKNGDVGSASSTHMAGSEVITVAGAKTYSTTNAASRRTAHIVRCTPSA